MGVLDQILALRGFVWVIGRFVPSLGLTQRRTCRRVEMKEQLTIRFVAKDRIHSSLAMKGLENPGQLVLFLREQNRKKRGGPGRVDHRDIVIDGSQP